MKTTTAAPDAPAEGWAAFTQKAATWPSISELCRKYGVSLDFVKGTIANGHVESIHLDRVRICEDSWIDFLRSRYSPKQH